MKNNLFHIQYKAKFLKDNKLKGEILISDNGSTDKSISISKKLLQSYFYKTRGYGAAENGINNAKVT